MDNDPEYYSIHQQLADTQRKHAANEFGIPNIERKVIEKPLLDPLDDIRASLKYILDQIANINQYIRTQKDRWRMILSEAEKMEIVKAFFGDVSAGKYSEEKVRLLMDESK